LDEHDARRIF
jgi:serine/threonine protein kinase